MTDTKPKLATKPRLRTHDITDCPRCGEDHAQHPFLRLQRPSMLGGGAFEWWGTCPSTSEPIIADIPEARTR